MSLRNSLVLFLIFLFTTSLAYAEKNARPDRIKEGKPVVCAANKEYNVGDRGPSNGWIIYKKPTATDQSTDTCWQYLEAAPADVEGKEVWSNVDNKLAGATRTGIGDGKENTKKIMAQTGHTQSAAKTCDDFVVKFGDKTYGDWFLPSKDELDLMYLIFTKKHVGNFKDEFYWSSSEFNDYGAWGRLFYNGAPYFNMKYYVNYVRCVRAF